MTQKGMTKMTENETGAAPSDQAGTGNVIVLPSPPEESVPRKVTGFVQEHPVLTIAGGLAVGALVAALVPRKNRAFIAKRSSMLAEAVSAASIALAQQALEKAHEASSDVRRQADMLAERAGDLGHATVDRMERIGETAMGKAHGLIPGRKPVPPSFTEKLLMRADEIKHRLHR